MPERGAGPRWPARKSGQAVLQRAKQQFRKDHRVDERGDRGRDVRGKVFREVGRSKLRENGRQGDETGEEDEGSRAGYISDARGNYPGGLRGLGAIRAP